MVSLTWAMAINSLVVDHTAGLPSCLGVIIILEHQVVGVLTGTLSITPSLISRSSPAFTGPSQCRGTGAGLCTATGVALSSINKRKGGLLVIRGNGCCSQVLNAEAAYLSTMY